MTQNKTFYRRNSNGTLDKTKYIKYKKKVKKIHKVQNDLIYKKHIHTRKSFTQHCYLISLLSASTHREHLLMGLMGLGLLL